MESPKNYFSVSLVHVREEEPYHDYHPGDA